MRSRMPAVFWGHGNPMYAVADNSYTQAWARMGEELPRPEAIIAVSAHWFVPGTWVTSAAQPRTIHDFGGFPQELYAVQYPAPGSPHLARRIQEVLDPLMVGLDGSWGLDHGTWSVLRHVYPKADIPIVQLSIDETKPASFHFDIGRRLAPLRDEGILIVGSGNIVHNLHAYSWGRRVQEPYDWTVRFETKVRELLLADHPQPLIDYEAEFDRDAVLCAPTPEHYLPLLYVIGTRAPAERIAFPVEGVDGGSISMLAVQVGGH